jgi:hypothetical protein
VQAVQAALDPVAARRVRVTVERPGTVGSAAVVTVVLPYRLGARILGGLQVALRARAVMRVER